MKKNIITVIYPGEFRSTFVIESDATPESILETVFAQWNGGSGQESELFKQSRVRSFCINDIATINGEDYQCRYFGWEPVTLDYVKELENKVKSHPKYSIGAWFALGDVMRIPIIKPNIIEENLIVERKAVKKVVEKMNDSKTLLKKCSINNRNIL